MSITLTDALNAVHGPNIDWWNPIRPCVVSGVTQTPYDAYVVLKPEYQRVVVNLIGHNPGRDET